MRECSRGEVGFGATLCEDRIAKEREGVEAGLHTLHLLLRVWYVKQRQCEAMVEHLAHLP